MTNEFVVIEVVIVDDDIDTVEIFAEYLEIKGFKVLATGANGKEAVELYEKYKPDILFTDIMMPVYDGFYAIENIKKIDPSAKIIMVTADLSVDTRRKISTSGASAIIFKPYDIDDTVNSINDVMSGKIIPLQE